MSLNFQPSEPNFIKLNGTKGTFSLPKSLIKVHFVQTVANPESNDGHSDLLDSLKPLREHVRLNQIESLDDVLQRDVSDARVGLGLVKYLLDNKPTIPTFFPSIVVVLVPMENFTAGSDYYPEITKNADGTSETIMENGIMTNYGNFWRILEYISGEKKLPLAELSFNPRTVLPLVIDGQHRTAGFKYISKKYDFNGKNAIYEPFYESNRQNLPENFSSDLPVTILWFESLSDSAKINSKTFARSLFVSINQSSQSIAKSRKLLLSEDRPTSYLTRLFYDYIANQESYKVSLNLSLLHSGFDYPKTLGKNSEWIPSSIFIPELLEFALDQILFKSHSSLTANKLTNTDPLKLSISKFESYFGNSTFSRYFEKPEALTEEKEEYMIKYDETHSVHKSLADRFNRIITIRLYDWINANPYYKSVFEVLQEIDTEFNQPTGPTIDKLKHPFCSLTWDKIFLGAEGLYYDVKGVLAARDYKEAVEIIIDVFYEKLASRYNFLPKKTKEVSASIREIHGSINTVACFTGYLLTFDYLISRHEPSQFSDTLEKFKEQFDAIKFADFIYHIKYVGNFSYLSNIDPKSACSYRNIYLRLLHKDDFVYSELENECLEAVLYRHEMENKLKAYRTANGLTQYTLANILQDIRSSTYSIISKKDFEVMDIDVAHMVNKLFSEVDVSMIPNYSKNI